MSSLAQQLAAISAGPDPILDKSSRKKVHSVSLIYDSKTASAQDYETIFTASLDALRELEVLDSRFAIFEDSLFSDSSIGTDRSLQTAEQNELIDSGVEKFLSILAPRLHLEPAVRALEWLVRRFQIHTMNAEILLLTALPSYTSPVFLRILDIVTVPQVFSFLKNSKSTLHNPSRDLLVRALAADQVLFELINSYVVNLMSTGLAYNALLAFWSSMAIWVLVSLKSNSTFSHETIVARVLPHLSATISLKKDPDCQIAAYIILAVVGTQFDLSTEVRRAAIQSVSLNWSKVSVKSGLSCITQLVSSDMTTGTFDAPEWDAISKIKGLAQEIHTLSDKYDIGKFVAVWASSVLRHTPEKANTIQPIVAYVGLADVELLAVVNSALGFSIRSDTADSKTALVPFFEWLSESEASAAVFSQALATSGISFDQLEMALQSSISKSKLLSDEAPAAEADEDIEMENVSNGSQSEIDSLTEKLSGLGTTSLDSFISREATKEFQPLVSLFTSAIKCSYIPPNGVTITEALRISDDMKVSFLARVWIGPYANTVRAYALREFSTFIENNQQIDFQATVPLLVTALADDSEKVRRAAGSAVVILSQRYPMKKPASVWALDSLYGSGVASENVKWLNATEIKKLLSDVLLPRIDECYIDASFVLKLLGSVSSNKELKALHDPLLAYLSSHAVDAPFPHMKTVVLQAIVNYGGTKSASKMLSPLLSSWIDDRMEWEALCIEERASFAELEKALISTVNSSDKVGISFLERSMRSEYSELSSNAGQRVVQIWPLLRPDTQLYLLRFFTDVAVDKDLQFDPAECLNVLEIGSNHFFALLNDCKLERQSAPANGSSPVIAKRQRRSSSSSKPKVQGGELMAFAEKHLRKLTTILELLEKNKPEGSMPLLTQLFTILGEILSLGDSNLPVLYTEQILANCMIETVEQLKKQRISKLDTSSIRVDIIVSCIRTSSSPQVQNRFLLLVASLANLAPEVVLHSVMPIFTFMGANTIRQDDEFSAHVIQQTISQVIPALLASGQDSEEKIEFLLLSFIAAFSHIPRHRRVKLFGALVKTLGPNDSLHKFLVILGQRYAEARIKRKSVDAKSFVHFGTTFMRSFTVEEQVMAIRNYLKLCDTVPTSEIEQEEAKVAENGQLLASVVNNSVTDNVSLKSYLYDYLTRILGEEEGTAGQSLRIQMVKVLHEDKESRVMVVYSDIIERLLVSRQSAASVTAGEGGSAGTLATSSLKSNLFKLLGKCLEMLPVGNFVSVVEPLLQTSDSFVSEHSLALIQTKFEMELVTDADSLAAATTVVSILQEFLTTAKQSKLLQAANDDLDVIIGKYGAQMEPEQLLSVLSVVVGGSGLLNDNARVFVAAVGCVNSICSVLGARMIGFFSKVVPVAIARFHATIANGSIDDEESDMIELATFGLMAGLIKRIPSFMTSTLKKIFEMMFVSSVDLEMRRRLLDVILLSAETKEVISSLVSTWGTALKAGLASIDLFLEALDGAIDISKKKLVSSLAPDLISFVLEAFEVRGLGRFDSNDTNHVETKVVASTIQIVMKLNDKTFRPLFVRIVRWAVEGAGSAAKARDSHAARLVVFFKLLVSLLRNLKSIVTSYYGYILDPVCDLLDQFVKTPASLPVSLRRTIVTSLTLSFQHDNDEFWQSQARFEKISKALLEQLSSVDNSLGSGLVKAIVAMAEVCSSPEHHKSINEGLCTHLKSSCASTEKIWAAKTLHGLYDKLGEEWVSMLPQLVPLVAELLEDDDEEVELEVRRNLVPVIEEVLGESLDRYLS